MTEAYASGILGAFTSPEDRVRKLQYMQYENIRVTMENVRRHKWYSSAILYWMYNDCWPASGWSIVDYYAVPKAAYYGFAVLRNRLSPLLPRKRGSIGCICATILWKTGRER